MPSTEGPASDAVAELQRRTRELLKAQQDAYLAAVKAWSQGIAKDAHPSWPPGAATQPTPAELAEASYAFAAKLLADQSRFLEELSKTIGGAEPPRGGPRS